MFLSRLLSRLYNSIQFDSIFRADTPRRRRGEGNPHYLTAFAVLLPHWLGCLLPPSPLVYKFMPRSRSVFVDIYSVKLRKKSLAFLPTISLNSSPSVAILCLSLNLLVAPHVNRHRVRCPGSNTIPQQHLGSS